MERFVALAMNAAARPAVAVPALDVDGTLLQVRFGGAADVSTSSDLGGSGGGAAAAYGPLGVAAAVREALRALALGIDVAPMFHVPAVTGGHQT